MDTERATPRRAKAVGLRCPANQGFILLLIFGQAVGHAVALSNLKHTREVSAFGIAQKKFQVSAIIMAIRIIESRLESLTVNDENEPSNGGPSAYQKSSKVCNIQETLGV